MELASCGYIVIALSHDDRSSDYTPNAGPYDSKTPNYVYDVRNKQVKIREKELLALVQEVTSAGFMESLGFKLAELTEDLVIMGHSFGGVAVMGVSKDCPEAKAVIGLDPWMYPHHREEIGCADH